MKIKSQSGSVLLATLSFIILLAVAAGSVLELTMNSYKLTMRNELRVQARSVAETEMESIYFQWLTLIMSGMPANQTPPAMTALAEINMVSNPPPPTLPRTPFLAVHQNQGWVIHRSINYDSAYDYYYGIIPQSQGKLGYVTYITVKVEVVPPPNNFFQHDLTVRVGRNFSSSNYSIFQYGVFFQGDLEMAPGSNVTINGDVAANGSIYMGSSGGSTLTLNRQVRYLAGDYFNEDSLDNIVLRKPNTPVGGVLAAPVFGTSQLSQVSPLQTPENLLGGVDPANEVSLRGDLYASQNDVYRAAIVPPPAFTDEYPSWNSALGDDPNISATRMYNRAGLIVTVNTDNSVTFAKADGTVVTAGYGGVVVGAANAPVYDQREAKNVLMTTIDMGALMTQITSNFPTGTNDFNGAVYFNVRSSNSTTPRAIRLTNGSNVYYRTESGMSVSTNGGLYVKGDYNTLSNHLVDGSTNPAMLMADSVTALSTGWNDANAALPLVSRIAAGPITIDAGILTGNIPATTTNASGGAQNLLRYLENWNGLGVTVNGSLGRLFQSETFVAPFQQPGLVYGTPGSRSFVFDVSLLSHPPAGSPQITSFERGTFFVW